MSHPTPTASPQPNPGAFAGIAVQAAPRQLATDPLHPLGETQWATGEVVCRSPSGEEQPLRTGTIVLPGDVLIARSGAAQVWLSPGVGLVISDGAHVAIEMMVGGVPDSPGLVTLQAHGGRLLAYAASTASPAAAPLLVADYPFARIVTAGAAVISDTEENGLAVELAQADGSVGGVTVINPFGEVLLETPTRRVVVAAEQQPPQLEPIAEGLAVDTSGEAPENEAGAAGYQHMEVSPGGDLDASTGEFLVTASTPAVFHLEPGLAPLASLVPSGSFPSSGISIDRPLHLTEEVLLQFSGGSAGAAGGLTGTAFRQLKDWEPLGLSWDALGGSELADRVLEADERAPLRTIAATEGGIMALVPASREGTGNVEAFLALPEGALSRANEGAVPAGASAIRASVTVRANDQLSFDWFFDPANQTPRADFAVFTVNDQVFRLADATQLTEDGATGWRTFVYTAPSAGTLQLGFATVNDRTVDDPARLFIDNVRVGRTIGANWQLLDSGDAGQWATYAQRPSALDDSFTTSADLPFTVSKAALLGNDVDPDPFDALRFFSLDPSGVRGSVLISGDTITYDPSAGFRYLAVGERGQDTFHYSVDAGNGLLDDAAVNLTVIGVNDAPIVLGETANAVAGDPTPILVPVLANDDDVDTDDDHGSLRVVAASAASGATVTFSGERGAGLQYSTAARFDRLSAGATENDTVTYTVEDSHGARTQGTLVVKVTGVNDAPTAIDDRANAGASSAMVISVLANDTDPDSNDTLSVSSLNGSAVATLPNGAIVLASGARLSVVANSVVYDPDGRFAWLAEGVEAQDQFRYGITDQHGATDEALVTVTVTGRNDAPTATADSFTVAANAGSLMLDVLANDDDVDSDDDAASLRIVAASAASGAAVSFTGAAGEQLGYVVSEERYRALGAGEVATDLVSYTLADRHGAQSSGTATLSIVGVNDRPVAADDHLNADEDSPAGIAALANDHDPDRNDMLRIVTVEGSAIAVGGFVTLASGARVMLDGAGTLVYHANGRFDDLAEGEVREDAFRYGIDDGHGEIADAVVHVTVQGRNDAPVPGVDYASTTDRAAAISIDVLNNDRDPDGPADTASLRILSAVSAAGATVGVTGTPGSAVTYDPAGRFRWLGAGETAIDHVTYTVIDRLGARAEGTIEVTVTGINDAPLAVADELFVDAGTVLREPGPALLANDTDADLHDHLTVVAVNGLGTSVGQTITLESGALLRVDATGAVTYDPNGRFGYLRDYEQAADEFVYTAVDEHGATSTASVTIRVQGRNDPPVAVADEAMTDQNSAVRISVLANDTDADAGFNLRVLDIDVSASRGAARINADGTITYDPSGQFAHLAAGELATDTFHYTLDDHVGGRSEGTVVVTVVGTGTPAAQGQLLQSFEAGAFGFVDDFRGSVWLATGSLPGLRSWQPASSATDFQRFLVLDAAGTSAASIADFLSNDISGSEDARVRLPNDPVDHSEAVNGSAYRMLLSVSDVDRLDGRIAISFDWNFLAGEQSLPLNSTNQAAYNDVAIFSVSDGSTTRTFTLSDVRAVGDGASGWRTSTYVLSESFPIVPGGTANLTVGFAVLNDASTDNPSRLLIDNIRLNRPIGDELDLVSEDVTGTFSTYRERPHAADDTLHGAIAADELRTFAAGELLANDEASRGSQSDTLQFVGVVAGSATGDVSADGLVVRYDPRVGFAHLAAGELGSDSFEYLVTDSAGALGRARAFVSIIGVNDAPTAAADQAMAFEGGEAVAIAALANDDDVDSDDDRTSLRIVDAIAASGAVVEFSGQAGAGILYRPTGSGVLRALGEGETGVDQISYVVEDSHGARSTGVIDVVVTGRNDSPTAVDDIASTDQNTVIAFPLLGNDQDPDVHDHLSVVSVAGAAIAVGQAVVLASGARISVDAQGLAHYDPAGAFAELTASETRQDTIHYTVGDGHGGFSDARIVVTVNGRNDVPLAATDYVSAIDGTVRTLSIGDLLGNDRDPDTGDTLRLVGVEAVGHGQVSLNAAAGTVQYDPGAYFRRLRAGEIGDDLFHYQIADASGERATGTVQVTVVGVNDAPVAADDVGLTDEDTAVRIDVLANDADPDDGDSPFIDAIDTSQTRGLVMLNADGTLTYDPVGQFDYLRAGETAEDRFFYRVSDGHGGTSTGEALITILGRSNTERLVESFEGSAASWQKTSTWVTRATELVEPLPGGGTQTHRPTDDVAMASLQANGSTARQIEAFLGIADQSLPRDPVDSTFAANGSALKLQLTVAAGDRITFDWLFDARDTLPDNDFALFSVVGAGINEFYTLSDVRDTGSNGDSGWRSSVYQPTAAGELTIGYAVVNDRSPSPTVENSFLLIDNIRINRVLGSGYQLADHDPSGRFDTYYRPEDLSS